MSITNRASLTAYFQTGDIPSESNFVDLIESSATLSDENTFTLPISVNRTNSAGNANQLIIDGNGIEKSYDETASTSPGDNSGDVLTLRGSSSFLAPITGVGSSISIFGNLRSTAARLEKSKNIYFDADKHNFTGLNNLGDSELLTIDSGSTGYSKEINLSAAKISLLERMSVTRPGLSSLDFNIRDTSSTAVSSVSSIFNINVNDLQAMTLSGGTVSTKITTPGIFEAPTVKGSNADFTIGNIGQGVFETTSTGFEGNLSAQGSLTVDQNIVGEGSLSAYGTNPNYFNGKVGIGTTSPEGDLHIVGKTGDAGRIYLNDKDDGATSSDALLITKSGENSQIINMDTGALNLGGNGQAQLQIVTSPGPGINVLGGICGYGDLEVGSSSVGKLYFDCASSHVGIGVNGSSVPDKALTVVGDISASGQILAGGGFTGDIAGCTSITVVEGIITAAS